MISFPCILSSRRWACSDVISTCVFVWRITIFGTFSGNSAEAESNGKENIWETICIPHTHSAVAFDAHHELSPPRAQQHGFVSSNPGTSALQHSVGVRVVIRVVPQRWNAWRGSGLRSGGRQQGKRSVWYSWEHIFLLRPLAMPRRVHLVVVCFLLGKEPPPEAAFYCSGTIFTGLCKGRKVCFKLALASVVRLSVWPLSLFVWIKLICLLRFVCQKRV